MKVKSYKKFVLLLITLSLVSCGRRMEHYFIQELSQMLTRSEDGVYSDEVMNSVFDFITNNPQSLEFEFNEEIPCAHIVTSNDGNVRAYNLERSGFCGNPSLGLDCKTLIQYKSGMTVHCKVIDDFNGCITHIHHIDSSKYYLLEDWQESINQGMRGVATIYVFKIENNKLHSVKNAFVNNDKVFDILECPWDDLGGHIDLDFEKEDSLFIYNVFQKELFVVKEFPVEDKPLKYRQYCWNGACFELRKYDEPLEFYNERFFIRIEQNSENAWTYKCWNGGKKKGEPNLIIKSGTKQYWLYEHNLISYDEWVTDDESTPLGEKYTFFNNGYQYEFYHGWSRGGQLENLYVSDPNENEIYSGCFSPVIQR